LLTMETLPLAAPDTVGANCTVTVTLWFGAKVTAPPPEAIENPAPDAVIALTATFAFPVLVILKVCDPVLPTVTLPKGKVVGVTDSVCVDATPVPLNVSVDGEFGALLVSERVPVTLVADVGAN
jgi:hypothetical protein